MSPFGGEIAEFLASLGTVAAGGAFIGTAIALAEHLATRVDQANVIDRIAILAASMSVGAVIAAGLEEVVT